jgi:predicted PurR-regulated permease PerM
MQDARRWPWPPDFKDGAFVRRVLIVIGLVALALAVRSLSGVLLLAFAAVLVAVILRALADRLVRHGRVPPRWSLTVAGLIILVIVAAALALFGAQMRVQIAGLFEQLPMALNRIARELGLGDVTGQLTDRIDLGTGGAVVARLAGIGTMLLGALADFMLVVIAGVFIAASPTVYREGLIKLFPTSQHERIRSSLDASGEALKLWLAAQLMAMTFVGVSAALGLWLIGVPSPFALGLIAALLDFIPFIGPILGALPAVLIASTVDGSTALWTILLFVLIQQIEGNVVFPLAQHRMASMPPALALFAIVAAGVLFGPLGVTLGFPLAVVAFVLVKKLYVRETLGEATEVPGEKETPAAISEQEGVPGPQGPGSTTNRGALGKLARDTTIDGE